MIIMNENIVFLNIINREGQLSYLKKCVFFFVYVAYIGLHKKKHFLSCFLLGSDFLIKNHF